MLLPIYVTVQKILGGYNANPLQGYSGLLLRKINEFGEMLRITNGNDRLNRENKL